MVLEVNRNFALLYGIMLGDGCLSLIYGKKKYVAISGDMKKDLPFFEGTIKPIIKSLLNKDIPIKFKPYCGSIELNFANAALFDFISSFGFPPGKKGNKLFIPKIFYEKNLVKYVLQGFFATDGSLVVTDNNGTLYPRVEANGIAKDLINEINNLLNKRGVKSKFYRAKRKNFENEFPNCQPSYRLQANGVKNLKKFLKSVGFINPKHKKRLQYYYDNC
jgi:hypothetical protein